MKLVDRLIWQELLGPLLNSIFMFLMLLFASNWLFKLTDLLTTGIPFGTVMQLALYSLTPLVTQTLPMGMLLGTLLAFGRLSSDSEHIALFASGISFYRVIRPVIWVGLLISLIAIAWNETVVPPTTRRFYSLLQRATEHTAVLDHPLRYDIKRPGSDHVDEVVIIDGGYDAKRGLLRKVTILKMGDDPLLAGQPVFILYADRAQAHDPKGLDWTFYDGRTFDLRPHLRYLSEYDFDELKTLPQGVSLGKDFRGVMQAEVTDNHQMTFRALRDKINRERKEGKEGNDLLADEVDLWEKISLPFASLIFGLVGAPLGVRPQRGSRAMGFGIAIVIIFFYWVVYHWMYVVGKNGGFLPPMFASFAADILGLIAAAFLVYRTRQ